MMNVKYKDTADVLSTILSECEELLEGIATAFSNIGEGASELQLTFMLFKELAKHKAIGKITAIFTGKEPHEVKIVEFAGMVGFLGKLIRESTEEFHKASL